MKTHDRTLALKFATFCESNNIAVTFEQIGGIKLYRVSARYETSIALVSILAKAYLAGYKSNKQLTDRMSVLAHS